MNVIYEKITRLRKDLTSLENECTKGYCDCSGDDPDCMVSVLIKKTKSELFDMYKKYYEENIVKNEIDSYPYIGTVFLYGFGNVDVRYKEEANDYINCIVVTKTKNLDVGYTFSTHYKSLIYKENLVCEEIEENKG